MKIILKIFVLMTLLLFVINNPLRAQALESVISGYDRGGTTTCPEWTIDPTYDSSCSNDFSVEVVSSEVPDYLDPCTHACFIITVTPISNDYTSYLLTSVAYGYESELPNQGSYGAMFCIGPDSGLVNQLPTTIDIDIVPIPATQANNEGDTRQLECIGGGAICSVMIGG